MKAIIFIKDYESYKVGDVYFIGAGNSVQAWADNHWLFIEGYVTVDDVPNGIPAGDRKAEYLKADVVEEVPEHWTKPGNSNVRVDPKDPSWQHVPRKPESWSVGLKPGWNGPQISLKYKEMLEAILSQMEVTFGTTEPVSASAYKETWDMMVSSPQLWVPANLTARFDRGGLAIGDPLDTVEKVMAYSNSCASAATEYGIWRMTRIEQFRQERDAILAGS